MKYLKMVMALGLVLVVATGCTQWLAERATERAIEQSAGGDAAVDFSDGTFRANVNGISIETGVDVALPSMLADDVYVIDGQVMAAAQSEEEQSYTVSIQTGQTPAAVLADYQEQLTSRGWTITGTANYGGTVTLVAEKDARTFGLTAVPSGDGTTMVTFSESAE